MIIALSLLSSLALAADPAPGMTLEVPTLGVTMVVQDGCNITVVGTVPARKAGELAKATADARSQCLTAQARVDAEKRRDQMATTRTAAEATLISAAAVPVINGRSVSYESDGDRVSLVTGPAAEWQAYGEAVARNPNALGVGGAYDPRFVQPFVLDQGRAGFMAHPAVPGTVVTTTSALTAECGTAAECQARVAALSSALAEEEE